MENICSCEQENFDIGSFYIKEVLKNGKPFPRNTWKDKDGNINYDNAKIVVKLLIEDVLKWSDKQVVSNLSADTFKSNKLFSMLKRVFNYSVFNAIDAAYPGKYKPWLFKRVTQDYWNLNTAKEATIWLINERLKIKEEEIPTKLSVRVFYANGLAGMIQKLFNASLFATVNNAYPNKFAPWMFTKVSDGYWNKQTGVEALKWLIEKKLKWGEKEVKHYFSAKVLKAYGLTAMLDIVFKGSPYVAINTAYPNLYKPWQLTHTPTRYWNKKTAKEATIWLIEEKLHFTDEDIFTKLSRKVFCDNGLSSMLGNVFRWNIFEAVDNAYPNKYKPWLFSSFKYCARSWSEKITKEAIIWLIEEELKLKKDEILDVLTIEVFHKYMLEGVLNKFFNGDIVAAVNSVYPGINSVA